MAWNNTLSTGLAGCGAIVLVSASQLFSQWWQLPGFTDPVEVKMPAKQLLALLTYHARKARTAVFIAEDPLLTAEMKSQLLTCGSYFLTDGFETMLSTNAEGFNKESVGEETEIPIVSQVLSCSLRGGTPALAVLNGELADHLADADSRSLILAEAEALKRTIISHRALSDDASQREVLQSLLEFLVDSDSKLVELSLADAVGDRRPIAVNSANYPSWRMPLLDSANNPVLLDNLLENPRFAELTELFDRHRG